jgi:hypothetical protein
VKRLTLEKLLVVSVLLGLVGLTGLVYSFGQWRVLNVVDSTTYLALRALIPSLTVFAISLQGAFNGFMLSILFMKTKDAAKTAILDMLDSQK